MKVLVTGAAGPRGRGVAMLLAAMGDEVIGVDSVDPPSILPGVITLRLDIRKRTFEDLIRRERFDAICHAAVHAGFRLPQPERHRLNIEGSQKVIANAASHGVKKLVVVSHAAIYGALADNPCFMTEDAPPSVGRSLPELQDVVTADLITTAAMVKYPSLEIVTLRPVNCLGPTSRDTLAQVLRLPVAPSVLGYDPMMQVIHEEDLSRAIAAALTPGLKGVYNVVGPGEVPLSVLIAEAGKRPLPLPGALLGMMLGRFGLPDAGKGVIEFLKHPCLIDGSRFREAARFSPIHDLVTTCRSVN